LPPGRRSRRWPPFLGIFGRLDVPIVYMSNRWWRTQHPARLRWRARLRHGPIDGACLPLDNTCLAAWGILILLLRYHVERQHQQIAAAEAQQALDA